MSYIKGTRKSQRPQSPQGFMLGNIKLPPGIVIASMLTVIYLMLTLTASMQTGFDATVLRLTSFILFAILSYSSRTRLQGMKYYVGIIDVFVLLSLSQLVWDLASFFNLYDASKFTGVDGLLTIGFINMLAAMALIIWYLSRERLRTSIIWLRPGNYRQGLLIGVPALALCSVATIAIAYLFYAAGTVPMSTLTNVLFVLAVFSIADAAAGELWFRGLFLSQVLPVAEKHAGYVIQAITYAFVQAIFCYTLIPNLFYAGTVLVASFILGLLWAELTIRNNSLLSALMFHIGVDLLIFLPVFSVFLI